MNLHTLNEKYKSDKGIAHSYFETYEELFSDIKNKNLNILEIGVLFGNSLKLWNDYFPNSRIYGIDDFSQQDGHSYYNFKKVDSDAIMEDLRTFERITFYNFNCEDPEKIKNILTDLKFDIIIDDANHSIEQQLHNFSNYYPYLKNNGIYVCEDITSNSNAKMLENHIKILCKNCTTKIIEFNIQSRQDDRLLITFNS